MVMGTSSTCTPSTLSYRTRSTSTPVLRVLHNLETFTAGTCNRGVQRPTTGVLGVLEYSVPGQLVTAVCIVYTVRSYKCVKYKSRISRGHLQ